MDAFSSFHDLWRQSCLAARGQYMPFLEEEQFIFRTPPKIPEIIMDESTFEAVVSIFHERFSQLLSELLNVACGNDLPLFFLALFSLWILSVIGTCFSFLNLLFVVCSSCMHVDFGYDQGLLCMETLPFLYERYEEQVEHLAGRMNRRMKKMYSRRQFRQLPPAWKAVDDDVTRKIHAIRIHKCNCPYITRNKYISP
ncbi:hypothetical protein L1049_028297 [Liquidambar formosana]|uniref:Reticulon-like protein n=1 Tax=Liquidambar formosana TaxID=63359 RepID=A0AAP0RII4_LIQFO